MHPSKLFLCIYEKQTRLSVRATPPRPPSGRAPATQSGLPNKVSLRLLFPGCCSIYERTLQFCVNFPVQGVCLVRYGCRHTRVWSPYFFGPSNIAVYVPRLCSASLAAMSTHVESIITYQKCWCRLLACLISDFTCRLLYAA
ncbi:unnamed protein product [Ectocarpus sp. 8 AP-2014]